MTPDQPYRSRYERGWRYSGRAGATLDHLDATRAPEAAYDGYLDRAAGREKWHLAWCTGCPDHGPRAAAAGLNPPRAAALTA
jgi:hypothetical protein